MQKKVTLSIDDQVYAKFQEYCDKNAIMLSKKIEFYMKELSEENKKGGKK